MPFLKVSLTLASAITGEGMGVFTHNHSNWDPGRRTMHAEKKEVPPLFTWENGGFNGKTIGKP